MSKSPHTNLLIAGFILCYTYSGLSIAEANPLTQMARVNISSGVKVPIPFEVSQASDGAKVDLLTTGPDEKLKYSVQLPASTTWEEGSITITPHASGFLYFSLLGPYVVGDKATKQLTPVFIDYDDVRINSSPVRNGGFEKLSSENLPADWTRQNGSKSNPPLDESNSATVVTGDSFEGSSFVRVWHNSGFMRGISVQENVPVTFSFKYRLQQ